MKKSIAKIGRGSIALVIALTLAALSFSASTATTTTTVSIQDVEIGVGESTTVPIMIYDAENVKGANIILEYNASVVHVTNISDGDFDMPVYKAIDNETGQATYVVVNLPPPAGSGGLTGNVTFAEVTLEAVGEACETSPLNLSVVSLNNGTAEIPREVSNGTFHVKEKRHDVNISTDYYPEGNGIKITRDAAEVVPPGENLTIGETYKIRYRVENEGEFDETVHMIVKLDDTIITEYDKGIDIGSYHRGEVEWDTTGLTAGVYTITVNASIADDANPVDNERTRDVTLEMPEDTTPPTIEFIAPTPANGTTVKVNYVNVSVRVTDPSGVDTVLLNWNGENETMTKLGPTPDIYFVNKTGLENGNYTYKVYANDIRGNMGVSETRVVIVKVCPRYDINEDGAVNYIDLGILGAHYGETTEPPYPRYDINEDGIVNYIDLGILGAHYEETGLC